MSNVATTSEAEMLREGMNNIADQLCALITGDVGSGLSLSTTDGTLRKLSMMVNLVIEICQRALRESEEREMQLRSILEAASEGMMTVDENGIVESFNRAAIKMFGYDAQEVLGRHIKMLIPRCDNAKDREMMAMCLRNIGTVRRHEVEGRRKDGTLFPLELAVSEVVAEGQRLVSAIMRDLTEQKQLQCELAQAQKLESVGQLAAGIAHEINTPTQYVGDNTRFLQDAFVDINTVLDRCGALIGSARAGAVDERLLAEAEAAFERADVEYLTEEIPQAIQQSLDGVQRVAKIVRAMKEFSHPGEDEKTLVNLREAIETTITVARNEWKYVAEMETDFDPGLPEVLCLPAELNQVFLNLIVNAAHAIGDALGEESTEKGTITVGDTGRRGVGRGDYPRHGHGDPRGDPFADLRPVLHNQGRREGHRAGVGHRALGGGRQAQRGRSIA